MSDAAGESGEGVLPPIAGPPPAAADEGVRDEADAAPPADAAVLTCLEALTAGSRRDVAADGDEAEEGVAGEAGADQEPAAEEDSEYEEDEESEYEEDDDEEEEEEEADAKPAEAAPVAPQEAAGADDESEYEEDEFDEEEEEEEEEEEDDDDDEDDEEEEDEEAMPELAPAPAAAKAAPSAAEAPREAEPEEPAVAPPARHGAAEPEAWEGTDAERLRAEVLTLRRELAASRTRNRRLQQESDGGAATMSELERTRKENERLTTDARKLRGTNQRLRMELKRFNEALDKMISSRAAERELMGTGADRATAERVRVLERELANSVQIVGIKRKEISSLQKRIATCSVERIMELEGRAADAGARAKQLEAEVRTLRGQLREKEKDLMAVRALHQTVETMDADNKALRAQLREHQAAAAAAEKHSQRQHARISQLNARVRAASQEAKQRAASPAGKRPRSRASPSPAPAEAPAAAAVAPPPSAERAGGEPPGAAPAAAT